MKIDKEVGLVHRNVIDKGRERLPGVRSCRRTVYLFENEVNGHREKLQRRHSTQISV